MNWIVCIARNSLALTKNAVASFMAQDIPYPQVWVIDNGSSDGTTQWLGSSDVAEVTAFAKPISVALAWNCALNTLFLNDAPYVLVANNDVELRPETYRLLVEDGGPFVTAVGVGERQQMTDAVLEPSNKRNHPDFSCFLIRREVWNKGLRFDESYEGAYCEDGEFHLALHRAGIPAYCIGVPFYHVASGTLKTADIEEQERIRGFADRNRALFKSRHGCDIGSQEYYRLFESR